MTTYKALERLSQSEFNLDRLELAASAAAASSAGRIEVPGVHLTVPGAPPPITTQAPSVSYSLSYFLVLRFFEYFVSINFEVFSSM